MSVIRGRLYFLGFAGLAVAIVYNALYLQEEKRAAASKREDAAEIALGDKGRAVTPGSASEIMRAIQRELAARGYDPGTADGLAGEKTRKAILAYQKKTDLPQTGQPSMELLRRIVLGESIGDVAEEPSPPPQLQPAPQAHEPTASVAPPPAEQPAEPATDPVIQDVQRVLADMGYAPGPVDGLMGEETRKAINAFERDRNMPQKGEVTPALIQEIERVTGRQIARQG